MVEEAELSLQEGHCLVWGPPENHPHSWASKPGSAPWPHAGGWGVVVVVCQSSPMLCSPSATSAPATLFIPSSFLTTPTFCPLLV